MPDAPDDDLSPLAREMVDGLEEFRDHLRSGRPIEERFRVTEVRMPDAEEQRLIDQAGGPEALEQIRREAGKAFPKGATVTVVPHEPIDYPAELERIAQSGGDLGGHKDRVVVREAAALIRLQAEELVRLRWIAGQTAPAKPGTARHFLENFPVITDPEILEALGE